MQVGLQKRLPTEPIGLQCCTLEVFGLEAAEKGGNDHQSQEGCMFQAGTPWWGT